MKRDKTMNANSGSVARQDDKSSRGKENEIEFREDSHGTETPEHINATFNGSDIVNGTDETDTDKEDSAKYSHTQTKDDVLPINKVPLEDAKNGETEPYDDLDYLNINIVPGECPGTIDIYIVSDDVEVCDQGEKTTVGETINQVETLERYEDTDRDLNIADQSETHENLVEISIALEVGDGRPKDKRSGKIGVASCKKSTTDQVTRKSNASNRHTKKEKEVIILSRKVPNKSRKSQSSPCLTDSKKVNSDDSPKFQRDAVNEHYVPHHMNATKQLPKRNQEPAEQSGKMKRFKGTSDLMVIKRQGASERGDFACNDKESEQKRSIIDEVDDAIPRVIPRSGVGKQVKFGDEIRGSRLIQPSPEKRCPSEEPSPNKTEKSILKKGIPSDDNCIEPQVYYNSSYVDDDSDGRDSGLPDDEDYRPCEYRDNRYQGYEYQGYHPVSPNVVSEPNSYQHSQYDAHAQSQYPLDDRGYGTPRSPRYFHSHRLHSAPQAADFPGRQAQSPIYCNRDVYEDYYSTDSQHVRRSPGSYPWATQTEVYTRENQYCLPTFDTSAFNNTKKATGSKKKNSDKKSRIDKKQQTRGQIKTETEIEKYQRLLGTGHVRLASRGSFDVRRIRLEYLLHIGDFSMKYKVIFLKPWP